MATFPFELVSPERLLISREVEAVTLPGAEGEFQILANHAPLLALLGPGVMAVQGGGEDERVFIDGGFCDMDGATCTVLAEFATPVAEMDTARIDAIIEEAEAASSALDDPARRDEAERRLATLRSVRATL